MSDLVDIFRSNEETTRLFVTLADSSDDFICLTSLQGKPFYLNAAGRRLVGLGDDEEIPTSALHDFHSDESWTELKDVAVEAVQKSGRWKGETQLRNLTTGELTDVQTRMLLLRGPRDDRPKCLAIVHRQIGSLARIEEALAESESRLRAILESSLDPIISIDESGQISEFNRAAEQVFGRSREEVLGKTPAEILFPESKSAGHQDRVDRYLAIGEGSMLGKRSEVVAVRKGGETFPAEMVMTITQQRGQPLLTFFLRDISQHKQAEARQARYAAELERSNRELEQFAYVASHDLQEPLRKIRTFGDRLAMQCGDALDSTGGECLQRMQDAAERMQTLINGVLTLSRVTTKEQEFVRVDLQRVAREVVSDLEVPIEQAGARVEVGKLPTIKADLLQMRQLLQNLIGNALKFKRDDRPPVVKVHGRFVHRRQQRVSADWAADEQCRIVVEDNGIGFDQKYQDRIFGVFQRLHPRDVFKGTGVGLAICRRIVERHGGTIAAESEPGKGATFVVVLPVAPHGEKS